ncbi:MAG: hypothetical protein GY811_22445 [Myxococcales bacterium]|nr:hypothetical protein [Myxococcales bacterium]
MIKNTLLIAALASLVSFSACKKDEKKDTAETTAKTTEPAVNKAAADKPAADKAAAPAGDMNRDEVAAKTIALFTKMNETVKAGAGDCDKIGAELTTIITGGKDVMEAAKKFDKDPEAKKWFDETHGKNTEGIMAEMMGGLATCMENDTVKKAFEGLE